MKNNIIASIVIPNWNGFSLLSKHLPSVLQASNGAKIIVVDDASTDGSIGLLQEKFPTVNVLRNKKRMGFASSVNEGVEAAIGDVVVLLNTDVRPERNFLKPLLTHFSDQKVFAVGCLEKSIEGGKTVHRGRGEASWRKGFYIHWRGETDKNDTAWVSGGSGAFRKDTWQKLHGMDSLYNPFYWEDIDLSYRAKKAGYHLVFEPKSIVWHFHEKGKIHSEYSKSDIQTIAYRNQFTFVWKNIGGVLLVSEHIIWLPIRLAQAIRRNDRNFIRGFFLALFRLPVLLLRRILHS